MGLGALAMRCSAVASSIQGIAAAAEAASGAMDRFSEKTTRQRASDEAARKLLTENSFGYIFEGWIAAAALDPNDPDLNKIEQWLREWTPQARDIDFKAIRRMMEKKRRSLGLRRGQQMSKDDTYQLLQLDDLAGR